MTGPIKRPSLFLYITEIFRAFRDFLLSLSFIKSFKPTYKGDGHPVLVIPGFMGDDRTTRRLRNFIVNLGYAVYPWGLGRNYADLEDIDILRSTIKRLHDQHQQKVSLIGWSLGGVYSRELAKLEPTFVKQVITLGSPFGGITQPNNAAWLFKLIKGGKSAEETNPEWVATLPNPAPVSTTALYSKQDGIVPWQACLETVEDDLHQNIEVQASHIGMVHHPEVWTIVEKRLAIPLSIKASPLRS